MGTCCTTTGPTEELVTEHGEGGLPGMSAGAEVVLDTPAPGASPTTGGARSAGGGSKEAATSASSTAAAPAVPPRAGAKVTFDAVLSDLDAAEAKVYKDIFLQMLPTGRQQLALDNGKLRSFIRENTAIEAEEVDSELLRRGGEDVSLNEDAFVQLIRDNAVSDTAVLEEFMSGSADGETLSAVDCRTLLHGLGQSRLNAELSEEQWDRILNTALMSAGAVVALDDWISFSKTTARIIRVCKAGAVLQ